MSNDNYRPDNFTITALAARLRLPRPRAQEILQIAMSEGKAKVVSRPGRTVWHYSWCCSNKRAQ